ncbi:Chromate transporter [Clostridioides difficile]|nr:chromate transporter [Clostridioides sp. ZZV14-6387]NJJ33928.1 chromate transporter [Clostridioides difficile]NJK13968.1 chromate transporter [Clostridioides difficile]CZR95454.1 Chromate transporter [Clostridioides difficile]CZS00050.1 Chromate transporter [Clostridioides difficile]
MKKSEKPYFWLLTINLFISTFTFGGGYVVVPMVRRYFVKQKQYFTEDDLMGMAAVAQSTPGAIAINLSALSGYRVAGTLGAIISCISAIIPPLAILGLVSIFYTTFISNAIVNAVLKGMQAGVAALIVDLIVDMCSMILKEKSIFLSVMIPVTFFANFIMGINVALILFVCCCVCIVRVFCKKRKNK